MTDRSPKKIDWDSRSWDFDIARYKRLSDFVASAKGGWPMAFGREMLEKHRQRMIERYGKSACRGL